MDQFNRDNYPYEGMAQQLGYDIEQGINEEQREILYRGSVEDHLRDKLKEFTGKGQKIRAIEDTINTFDGARSLLGIGEEIKDKNEPFTKEKVLEFYSQIGEENHGLRAEEFMTKYRDQFYGEMQPLERKFLSELSSSGFNSRLTSNLDGVDFAEDTVGELITKLTPLTPEETQAKELAKQEVDANKSKGWWGESSEFIGNVGRGFYNGLIDTASGTLRLTDTATKFISDLDKEVVYDPNTGDFIQRNKLIGDSQTIKDVDKFNNPEPGTLWKVGDTIQDALSSRVESDDFMDQVAGGIGQIGSMLTGGGLIKFLTGGAVKATAGGAIVGITQGGESGYKDYIQSIEEKDGDFSLSDAKATVGFNALIGASEVVPFLKPLSKLTGDGGVPIGALLDKIDKATGGIVGDNIKKVANSSVGKAAGKLSDTLPGDALTGAVTEATQEIVAGIAQDFVAANIVQYDTDRDVFISDGTLEGGEVGGVVGALMNGVMGVLGRKRAKKIKDQITGTPNTEDLSDEPLMSVTQDQDTATLDPNNFTSEPIAPQQQTTQSIDDVVKILESSIGEPVTTQSIDDVVKILESSIGEPVQQEQPVQTEQTIQTIADVTAILESSIEAPVTTESVDDVIRILESSIGGPITEQSITDVTAILESSIGAPMTDPAITEVTRILESSVTPRTQSINDVVAILESSIGQPMSSETTTRVFQALQPLGNQDVVEVSLDQDNFTTQPVVQPKNSSYVAKEPSGVMSVAPTPEQAIIDSKLKKSLLPNDVFADLQSDATMTTENLAEGGQRTIINTGAGTVTFNAPDAESEADRLIRNVKTSKDAVRLPDGLTITETNEGYEFELRGVKVKNRSLHHGLVDVNNIIGSRAGPSNQRASTKIELEEPSEPVIIGVSEVGFLPRETTKQLESNGFVLMKHFDKKAGEGVTEDGFVAYKDGFIYTVKSESTRRNSMVAKVSIRDLDGNTYKPNSNEATQEYSVVGVLQDVVSGPALDRTVQQQTSRNPGIVLRPPIRGIRVRQGQVGTDDGSQPITVIDSQSVDDIAQRLGGTSRQVDSSIAQILTKDSITSIAVTPSGDVLINTSGQGKELFKAQFNVTDTGSRTEASMSLITRELEGLNYAISEITPNRVTLNNSNGSKVSVVRSKAGDIDIQTDKGTQSIEDMGQFREMFNLPDKSFDPVTTRNDDSVDFSHDIMSVRQRTVKGLFDLSEQLSSVQIENGKPTFVNGEGTNVILDTGTEPDQIENALERLRINASIATDAELTNEARVSWEMSDLDGPMSLLPRHIRGIVDLHTESVNPASEIGAWGFFTPSDTFTARPHIHVDASKFRSFQSVMSTISEEVAHFSLDSWGLPQLDGLVDRMFELVKDDALRDLPQYIERNNMDVDNLSLSDKWVLTNEFFSKQGTSFLDFDDNKVSLPPGVTREQMRQLKKDVVGTVLDVVIDLRKDGDYKGTPEDAHEFITNILRLQAGSVLSEGVVLTYKINQPDGSPAEIVVRSTPYGSEQQTINRTRNAKRVAKLRQWLAKSSGTMKSIKQFVIANVFGVVDTAIGRENSIVLNGVYNPSSTAEVTMLKNVTLVHRRVERILGGLGLGPLPIEGSYHKTFVDNGITSNRSLKLAQELDQFMKIGFIKSNENIAAIRSGYRQSKRILTQIVENHPGARVNLARWQREIDQRIQRFSTDVDHIQYKAYQVGGDKSLIVMREAVRHRNKFNQKVDAARTKINEINSRADLSQTQKDRRSFKHMEMITTEQRLKSLELWAGEESRSSGGNVRGLMITHLDNIIEANQDYHTQSEGVGDFISALKGRKLDENKKQDRLFMDFLGRITDPVQVMLGTLEQQNKVSNNIDHTNKFAQLLVRDGIATPIGSTNTETLFAGGDTTVLASANGGLLNYLQVDPEIAVFIRRDKQISQALHQNIIGSGAVGKMITSIKANQTVLSPKLALSNFYSNISVLIAGGHLSHISKYKEAGTTIKAAWSDQAVFGQSLLKENETPYDMIADEMAELNVFQSGAATLDAQMTNGTVIGVTMDAIGSTFDGARGFTDGVNKFMELTRKFYSFGDEYSKVLPYLVNREIGIAQAQNEIKRDTFAPGKLGEIAYERAIVDRGSRIAADRTGRETNNWIIAPEVARATVKNKTRFILGDYILHPFQVMRIMIENKRLIVEDIAEYKKAVRDKNPEYAAIMKRAVANRLIGNVITDLSHMSLLSGGLTGVAYLLATVYDGLGEDEEDTPMGEKQSMTIAEMDAFYRVSNSVNSGWGGAAYYPISRDGYKVTYYDGKRLSSMNTLIPTKSATTETKASDYVKSFAGNFMNIDRESIALTLLNRAYYGKGRYDEKLTGEGQVSEVGKMFVPGAIKQFWDLGSSISNVMLDPTSPDGPDREQAVIEAAANIGGVKVKTLDLRDEVVNLGFRVTSHLDTRNNAVLRTMKKRLSSGDKLEQHDVAPMLMDMVKSNDEVMANIQYGVTALVDSGLTYDEIGKYIGVKTDGVTDTGSNLTKSLVKSILKNENGLHDSVLTQLVNQREEIKDDARVSHSLSQRDITNKLDALEIAIDTYGEYIEKMKGQ